MLSVWKEGERVSLAGKDPTSQRKAGGQGGAGPGLHSLQALAVETGIWILPRAHLRVERIWAGTERT